MSRIRLVNGLDDDASGVALARVAAIRGHEGTLYRLLANSPRTLTNLCELIWGLWDSVDSRVAELVILRVSQLIASPYEWAHHFGKAIASGISPAKVGQLSQWRDSELFDDEERVVLEVVESAATNETVAAETLSKLLSLYPANVCVDLFTLVGLYRSIGVMLNSFDIELEQWAPTASIQN